MKPIIVTRDSVCAGDDIDAPHRIDFREKLFLQSLVDHLIRIHYLPKISGDKATWIILVNNVIAGVYAQEWEKAIYSIDSTKNCNDSEIHFLYKAQKDPAAIAAKIQSWYDSATPISSEIFLNLITKEKKDRYQTFLNNAKSRAKILNNLYHMRDFSEDRKIADSFQVHDAPSLISKFKIDDMSYCIIISSKREIDGKIMITRNAFQSIFGSNQGAIIIIPKHKFCFYEGEDERYLLKIE